MWRFILSEVQYRRNLFSTLLLLVPVYAIYAKFEIKYISANYFLFWTIFLIIQQIIITRNVEKRNRFIMMLPISKRSAGLHRISLIVLPTITVFIIFYFFVLIIHHQDYSTWHHYLTSTAILAFIYALYFIFQDVLVDFFRQHGITADRTKYAIVLLMLGLNILGILAFAQASKGGKPSRFMLFVDKTIQWTLANHPFRGEHGYLKFWALSIIIAGLSVWTFERQKSIS
jgi:hypothetical protein